MVDRTVENNGVLSTGLSTKASKTGLVDETVEIIGVLLTGLSTKASKTGLVCKVVLRISNFLYRCSNQSLKTASGLQSGIENKQFLIPLFKPRPQNNLWFAKWY